MSDEIVEKEAKKTYITFHQKLYNKLPDLIQCDKEYELTLVSCHSPEDFTYHVLVDNHPISVDIFHEKTDWLNHHSDLLTILDK